MTPFNSYTPQGYKPNQPPPEAPTATAIPAGQKREAVKAGASHIAEDGYFCYRWLDGKVQEKRWYGSYYSMSWWTTRLTEMPADARELKGA